MPKFRVLTQELRALVDPLDGVKWGCGLITDDDVMNAAQEGTGIPELRSWQDVNNPNLTPQENRDFHLRRIATLIGLAHAYPEPPPEPEPGRRIRLVLIFNDDGLQRAFFNDGYHRVATAYLMGIPDLDLYITSSDDSRILEVLPGAAQLDEE